ncbi:division/cell wall cluster transcriptional repressor MraZ [Soonwooa sp.]|uniref:division/cell wall cluster transcriptional repressor MraZ n=1 Tax=Soonwooa sp. TaxID=1938592 RepID=UPI0028AED88F|nr:division/cell wall cluster transcriptional repressor MraZ [Soonwooa sp.]
MNHFIGTYECKIDDKGRIKLPSSLAKQLEVFGGQTLIVKRSVFNDCLEVYPQKNWEPVMKQVNSLNRFVKKNVEFIRIFTAGVKVVELDSSSRLQISKDLAVFANLTKDIVIASAGELFEVWDKEAYEAIINAGAVDFANLAEEVMGNNNNNDDVS